MIPAPPPRPKVVSSAARTAPVAPVAPVQSGRGADLLNEVQAFLRRFVAYPSDQAATAHALWVAHAHAMDAWESTPRIAFLSPEPGSGKSRALEVTELLVPNPVHAVNTTPAYLFRKVSDPDGRPTLLYDEVDTLFGPKAKDAEDIRGMLNAGHRRGATAGRCVIRGKTVETEELPAYCAVALAGLNDLPDTIATRSVLVRMRRRAPDERVEAFRHRVHAAEGHTIRDALADWIGDHIGELRGSWPDMPDGVEDRNADVWEALLAVADLAGGGWPDAARVAAVALVADKSRNGGSLGLVLLADCRAAFTELCTDRLASETLLEYLTELEESPWGDLRGKPLDSRGLSRRLSVYDDGSGGATGTGAPIRPKQVRIGERNIRGYDKGDFLDAWRRYLPPVVAAGADHDLKFKEIDMGSATSQESGGLPFGLESATSATSATDPTCCGCGGPMVADFNGDGCHPGCNPPITGISA